MKPTPGTENDMLISGIDIEMYEEILINIEISIYGPFTSIDLHQVPRPTPILLVSACNPLKNSWIEAVI